MAIKVVAMSNSTQYIKALTPTKALHDLIDKLAEAGVEFQMQYYFFLATPKGGKSVQTVLPVGTNTLKQHYEAGGKFTPPVAVAESKMRAALLDLGAQVLGKQNALIAVFGEPVVGEKTIQQWLKVEPNDGLGAAASAAMQFITPPPGAGKTGLKPGSLLGAGDPDSAPMKKEPVLKTGTTVKEAIEKLAQEAAAKKAMPADVATAYAGYKPVPAPQKAPVKLVDAQVPGQKVFGTSTGSIYTCVGIAPVGVKLAVRYAESQLSFRVEGGLHTGTAGLLQSHGFDVKSGYASMHLQCTSQIHARRAIGSVLFGTGIHYASHLSNLDEVFA